MKKTFVLTVTLAATLLTTAAVQAQSTNWSSGTNILSAPYGTTADSDLVDGATLIVTNGGSLTANLLNVGPTNAATLTLLPKAAIALQTLISTNVMSGVKSTFNFNGGTLTTSNGNALAAEILVPVAASWTNNGNWSMLGGTNITSTIQTSGTTFGLVYLANSVTNTTTTVSNAVWSTGNPLTPGNLTNFLSVYIGYNSTASNNVLNITNGGQVYVANYQAPGGGPVALVVGNNYANNNGLIVAGTNGAGQKSLLDVGNSLSLIHISEPTRPY